MDQLIWMDPLGYISVYRYGYWLLIECITMFSNGGTEVFSD